jgi:hypothetical protein
MMTLMKRRLHRRDGLSLWASRVSITVALNICIETAMKRATPTAKGHPGDADVSSSTSS